MILLFRYFFIFSENFLLLRILFCMLGLGFFVLYNALYCYIRYIMLIHIHVYYKKVKNNVILEFILRILTYLKHTAKRSFGVIDGLQKVSFFFSFSCSFILSWWNVNVVILKYS